MKNFSDGLVNKICTDNVAKSFLEDSNITFTPEQFSVGKIPSEQMSLYGASLELCLDYKGNLPILGGTKAKLNVKVCNENEFSQEKIPEILKKNGALIIFEIYKNSNPLYQFTVGSDERSGRIKADQKFIQSYNKK